MPRFARALRGLLAALAALTSIAATLGEAAAQPRGRHPNLLLNQREIEELRAVLASGEAPGYLTAAFQATLDGAPRGDGVETSFSPSIYTDDWHDRYQAALLDGTRASDAGLAWALTGDVEYARAARTILLAWTQATVGGNRDHGVADMGFIGLAWAYDLIFLAGVLSHDEQQRIEDWLLRVAAPLDASWHPGGPAPEYYDDHYGHAGYQNEFAWNNLLYGAVGFVTGDPQRVAWATSQQWPYEDFGRHPEFADGNPRSLREFIRGAIYRDSDRIVDQDTSAFVDGRQVVPDFRGQPVPNGSMYDFWHRGPSPEGGGLGQGYQMFTLQAMALLAEMAWHAGDDVFSWTAPNGNRLKDGFDFARMFAASANHPVEDRQSVFLYELAWSHYGDPADLELLDSSGLRAEPSGHFMRHKFALVGYAARRERRLGAIQGVTFTDSGGVAAVSAPVFLGEPGAGITRVDSSATWGFGGLPRGTYQVASSLPEGFTSAEHSVCAPGETGACHADWQPGLVATVEVPEGTFVDVWWRFR
ncbi:MAG: alginate lyase family protein [Thermodesulfobacteriota bacterium]